MMYYKLSCVLLFSLLFTGLKAQFKEVPSAIESVNNSSVAWGDYDRDGDLDVFLMGWNGKERVTRIYKNQSGKFTDIEAGLPGVNSIVCNNLAWADYDNDGLLDILFTGQDGSERVSKIYHNDGKDSFSEIPSNIPGVFAASVTWGDYDMDGQTDLLLAGRGPNNVPLTKLYKNTEGEFKEVATKLPGIFNGSLAWGDYDNDGDLDILLTGRGVGKEDNAITKIFKNVEGVFVDILVLLPGITRSSVAWGDYDNDGDLDILLTGQTTDKRFVSMIYKNENGQFVNIKAPLDGVERSSVAWGDYDNDGDLDILISGLDNNNIRITRVYQNKGNDQFSDINANLLGLSNGSVAWGDYDNDGDLDILVSGEDESFAVHTKLYENTLNRATKALEPPKNLNQQVSGNQVTLKWQTQPGVTYNVRVGTKKEGQSILSAMSLSENGSRLLPNWGNAYHKGQIILKSLQKGTYYWSVQAIGNNFKGSSFAQENTFVIE